MSWAVSKKKTINILTLIFGFTCRLRKAINITANFSIAQYSQFHKVWHLINKKSTNNCIHNLTINWYNVH